MTRATRYRDPGHWATARYATPCAAGAKCRGDGRIMFGDSVWLSRPPPRTHCNACGTHLQAIQRQAEASEAAAKADATAHGHATKPRD